MAVFTVTPSSAWPPAYSAAIYLQFKDDTTGQWNYLGSIGEGKDSAFFKVKVPESIANRFEVLTASLGISIVPTFNLPTTINISSNINSNISGNSTLSLSLSSSSSLSSSLIASLIASKPSLVSPSSSEAAINSLLLARKLLENFVNYALSFSQSFPTSPDTKESFIPAKIITDWYNGTVRRAQLDPVGFFQNLMKTTD